MDEFVACCNRRNITPDELLDLIHGLYEKVTEGVISEYLWTASY